MNKKDVKKSGKTAKHVRMVSPDSPEFMKPYVPSIDLERVKAMAQKLDEKGRYIE